MERIQIFTGSNREMQNAINEWLAINTANTVINIFFEDQKSTVVLYR